VSRYQKSKTNVDFTEARDSEWQWHQLGHMQVCTSLQTDNDASTPPLSFLQARCPSCRPTNSVKALKANYKVMDEEKITITYSIANFTTHPRLSTELDIFNMNLSFSRLLLFFKERQQQSGQRIHLPGHACIHVHKLTITLIVVLYGVIYVISVALILPTTCE